jgi:hypothetical protein
VRDLHRRETQEHPSRGLGSAEGNAKSRGNGSGTRGAGDATWRSVDTPRRGLSVRELQWLRGSVALWLWRSERAKSPPALGFRNSHHDMTAVSRQEVSVNLFCGVLARPGTRSAGHLGNRLGHRKERAGQPALMPSHPYPSPSNACCTLY